jgi:hypothetical protein
MRLVLYSLAALGSAHCERQWTASIRSLRRHNPGIRVRLCIYGTPLPDTLAEARRQNVEIVLRGDYRPMLEAAAPGRGKVLAANPTLHKIATMADLPSGSGGFGQILYLDCDTYCFNDIETLFDRYAWAHFHAREEPNSRRSPAGYDPSYIDEAALEALAQQQGLAFVPPYNTGVMMLNGGLWTRLAELFGEFLDRVWRLAPPHGDAATRLPMPTSNTWIIEEVATWLTLGRFPDLAHAPFDPLDVAQNGEAARLLVGGHPPRLAHYYSAFETDFFRALRSARRLAA